MLETRQKSSPKFSQQLGANFMLIFGSLEASGVVFWSFWSHFKANLELPCYTGGELWEESLAVPKSKINMNLKL